MTTTYCDICNQPIHGNNHPRKRCVNVIIDNSSPNSPTNVYATLPYVQVELQITDPRGLDICRHCSLRIFQQAVKSQRPILHAPPATY